MAGWLNKCGKPVVVVTGAVAVLVAAKETDIARRSTFNSIRILLTLTEIVNGSFNLGHRLKQGKTHLSYKKFGQMKQKSQALSIT